MSASQISPVSPIRRFRVGSDHSARLFFVRDTVTGRCHSGYRTASEAFHIARRANRALTIVTRELVR